MSTVFRARTFFRAPFTLSNPGSSIANQWFGTANVASAALGASVVVSTALVADDSIILQGFPRARYSVGSNATVPVYAVSCISPGGYFTLQMVNSTALVGSASVSWVIVNPR